ncbi:hypothetical protein M407DRAFT_30756 [Tulasnella calospora MUT 4182]|uniref:C2H2-type domain-containing protein n=1 Tax=Tulasnella calospora MUT 4182 TaxID=1051891 RepID=A0A0C3Q7P7_9AGAM|nr:hypothetical protein M407DRAFT_30756 [Tulasnella calospora MUT 4182]
MGRARSTKKTTALLDAFPEDSPANGHICQVCSRVFARATDVKRHVNAVHLGLRKFACPICGRGFAQKGGMVTHMNIHTGNRPYQCRVNCGHPPFSDPSSRSRHEFEAHAPPSFECPEGCASFKRKDALKLHLKEKHPDAVYPESLLANKMTRERFNAEFLADAIEEHSGGSSSPEAPASHRRVTLYKRRKLISMEDEADADEDDKSLWSALSSTVSRNEAAETHAPIRRSTRLASKPLISMKEETPDLSRAPTPSPFHSAIHASAIHSHRSTPIPISAAPSVRPSRVPSPVPYISKAGRKTPAVASRIGTPNLTVPPFHHPHSSHSPSPLGSRAHSPSRPTEADLLVRHLATHNNQSTPPMSGPVSNAPFHPGQAGTQLSQARLNETNLPQASTPNPVGLGLMNVNLSLPLSNYFGTEAVPAQANGSGFYMSVHGPIPFANSSLGSTVNPQALHTPPVAAPRPSTSYFPQFIHPTSAHSSFHNQLPSPAPTIFNSSPITPFVAGEDLDEELRRLFSPERSLMGVERVDLSNVDPAFFGC